MQLLLCNAVVSLLFSSLAFGVVSLFNAVVSLSTFGLARCLSGYKADTRLAPAVAAISQLGDEPEVSHISWGLLTSSLVLGSMPNNVGELLGFPPPVWPSVWPLYICCMVTNVILGEKQVHTLPGSCTQLAAELQHQALL